MWTRLAATELKREYINMKRRIVEISAAQNLHLQPDNPDNQEGGDDSN
jgi:hypothetical protein